MHRRVMSSVARSVFRSCGDDGEGNLYSVNPIPASQVIRFAYDGGNNEDPDRYH